RPASKTFRAPSVSEGLKSLSLTLGALRSRSLPRDSDSETDCDESTGAIPDGRIAGLDRTGRRRFPVPFPLLAASRNPQVPHRLGSPRTRYQGEGTGHAGKRTTKDPARGPSLGRMAQDQSARVARPYARRDQPANPGRGGKIRTIPQQIVAEERLCVLAHR